MRGTSKHLGRETESGSKSLLSSSSICCRYDSLVRPKSDQLKGSRGIGGSLLLEKLFVPALWHARVRPELGTVGEMWEASLFCVLSIAHNSELVSLLMLVVAF